jgi:hypothetical protein
MTTIPTSTRRGFVASLLMSSIACSRTNQVAAQESKSSPTPPHDVPEHAQPIKALAADGVTAYRHDHTLWLSLDPPALERGKVTISRLCAAMRSIRWKQHPDAELKFAPDPREWTFSWEKPPADKSIIEIVFDSPPLLLDELPPVRPAGDGSVMLHAFQAATHGDKLRFEPQPFKNTVGYWIVPTDYAAWQLTIDQPGTFAVAVLQGCGEGQGGSEGAITLRQGDAVKAELAFQTLDTGHFQNFRWRHLGMVKFAAVGEYELRIEAKQIVKNAFCDVRAVHLVRQAT